MKQMTMREFTELINSAIENNKYKELLDLIEDIVEIKKTIDSAISAVKDYIKFEQIDEKISGKTKITRRVYMKYKPVDIKLLQERYPINKYPEVYNISLSSKAKDIITDASLLQTVPVETVRIETIKEEDIDL